MNEIDYTEKAKEVVSHLFRKEWMSEQEWIEFLKIVFKETGLSYQELGRHLKIGVGNGQSIEYQVQVFKQLRRFKNAKN